MKKLLIAFFAAFFVFSCNNSGEKKVLPVDEGRVRIVAGWTNPDTTKTIDIMLRQIFVGHKYDSTKGNYRYKTDTNWWKPIYNKIDSLGRFIKDTAGKFIMMSTPQYYMPISSDSVNWHISGVPLDELMQKKYPLRGISKN